MARLPAAQANAAAAQVILLSGTKTEEAAPWCMQLVLAPWERRSVRREGRKGYDASEAGLLGARHDVGGLFVPINHLLGVGRTR